MIRALARSLTVALTIGLMTVSHQAAAQIVDPPVLVYGNDGFSPIGDVLPLAGVIPTTSGALSHNTVAQGFKVGENAYELSSVDVGLYFRGTRPEIKIALHASQTADDGVEYPGDEIRAFSNVPTTGPIPAGETGDAYNFGFGDSSTVRLEANTTYWITVSYTPQDAQQPTFYWLISGDSKPVPPQAQSGSGFVYAGTMAKHDFTGPWEDHGPSSGVPNASLRIGLHAVAAAVINPGGGGDSVPTAPELDCYALSKGFFRNKFPSGWPASVIADGGLQIGERFYYIPELRAMLATNSTGGNQIGQLSSQLVAVALSRVLSYEIAIQNLGQDYVGWDGWAPESDETRQAFDDAAALLAPVVSIDNCGRLAGDVRGVSSLIESLDGYIGDNHCDGDTDDDCDRDGKDKDKDKDKGKGKGKDKGKGKGGKDKDDDDRDHDHDYKSKDKCKKDCGKGREKSCGNGANRGCDKHRKNENCGVRFKVGRR